MRYAILILFVILGIVVGLVLPYYLQDSISDAGFTFPAGSTSPASQHEISIPTVLWFLRVLGICLGLIAILYFVLSRKKSEA
jgi:hypothetical protein